MSRKSINVHTGSRVCAFACGLGMVTGGISIPAGAADFAVAAGDVAGLAAAIIESNANADCFNRITLPAGTWVLTQVWGGVDGVPDTGLPLIDLARNTDCQTNGPGGKMLEISGASTDQTVIERAPGAPRLRHFSVTPGGFGGEFAIFGLVLSDLTLRGGDVFSTDPADFCCAGGAITVDSSDLRLNRVTAIDNRAVQGGVVWMQTGRLFINDSRLTGNSSARQGGAVMGSGLLRAERSTFSGNAAGAVLVPDASEQGGGAIMWESHSQSWIVESSIADNRILFNTRSGGGVYVMGPLEILQSELRANEATGDGGGLLKESFGGRLDIRDSTLSGNFAAGRGSAIDTGTSAESFLYQVTVASNEAPAGGSAIHGVGLVARATLVANTRLRGTAGAATHCSSNSSLVSEGYNLDSDGSCHFSATGDVSVFEPADVLDLVARDNGGATLTHALVRSGPAVDRGDPEVCFGTDQRGVARPQDGNGDGIARCDVGAYELLPVSAHFAGTPGKANCRGMTVSALAAQYGGLAAAASALEFGSVQALERAIRDFCREG